jgi:hypothetical protein
MKPRQTLGFPETILSPNEMWAINITINSTLASASNPSYT